MNDEIINILRPLIKKRMEIALIEIRKGNPEYQHETESVIDLDKKYESMELEPELKEFIDRIIEAHEDSTMNQLPFAYLAGVQDCIKILESLKLLNL